MSDLTSLRDHARRMSTAVHRDDCNRRHRTAGHGHSCADETPHDAHTWAHETYDELTWRCPGLCGGCLPDNERRLWRQIADEIAAYLAPDDDQPSLEDA